MGEFSKVQESEQDNILLLSDRTKIENIVKNDVVGRSVIQEKDFFKVYFYGWETPKLGKECITFNNEPDVMYIIPNKFLTEELFDLLVAAIPKK